MVWLLFYILVPPFFLKLSSWLVRYKIINFLPLKCLSIRTSFLRICSWNLSELPLSAIFINCLLLEAGLHATSYNLQIYAICWYFYWLEWMTSPIKCSLEAWRLLNTKHQCLQVAFGTSILWIWFIARFWQFFSEQLCTASWKLVLYFCWYNYVTFSQQDLICVLLITETLQSVESVNGLGGQHMQVQDAEYIFSWHISVSF